MNEHGGRGTYRDYDDTGCERKSMVDARQRLSSENDTGDGKAHFYNSFASILKFTLRLLVSRTSEDVKEGKDGPSKVTRGVPSNNHGAKTGLGTKSGNESR